MKHNRTILLALLCLVFVSALTLAACGVNIRNEKELASVSVVNLPDEPVIIGGFDDAGMSLKLTYTDGESDIVPLRESMFGESYRAMLHTPGTHVVEVLYRGKTATFSITMREPVKAYTRDGDYIYFGSYPQTEVKDGAITSALNSAAGALPTSANNGNWTSYGYYISGTVQDYMWYIDLTYGGEKYRGVYFTSYRPPFTGGSSLAGNSDQDENGYNVNSAYWFRYEPVKWRILEESNGTALLLCEMIIDSREYYHEERRDSFSHNGGSGYANNYALSNIRKWLNETFYNTAFTELQRSIILKTTVDNSARSTYPNGNATQVNNGANQYACENTQDYIFLLSQQEATNSAYGFNASYSASDTARRKQTTDYAKAQGAYTYSDSEYDEYDGNGGWWLRSPCCYRSIDAGGVSSDGNTGNDIGVNLASLGVVPALKITL